MSLNQQCFRFSPFVLLKWTPDPVRFGSIRLRSFVFKVADLLHKPRCSCATWLHFSKTCIREFPFELCAQFTLSLNCFGLEVAYPTTILGASYVWNIRLTLWVCHFKYLIIAGFNAELHNLTIKKQSTLRVSLLMDKLRYELYFLICNGINMKSFCSKLWCGVFT